MTANSRALVYVHIAALLFGLAGVLGDVVALNAIQVTFGRALFASLALFAVVWFRRKPGQSFSGGTALHRLLIFSGVLLAFHWVTFFASIHASTVAIGLVTFSTCPVFVALLEPWFFRERLKPLAVVAALIVFVGVLVISGVLGGELVFVEGILFGIASGLSFAILQLLNRKLAVSVGSVTVSFVQNSIAALLLLPIAGLSLGAIQSTQWMILIFIGVGCTALAHTLFVASLKRVKVATASLIAAGLEPIYGILLAALILSQLPGMRVLTGGAMILAAVLLMTYSGVENKE